MEQKLKSKLKSWRIKKNLRNISNKNMPKNKSLKTKKELQDLERKED